MTAIIVDKDDCVHELNNSMQNPLGSRSLITTQRKKPDGTGRLERNLVLRHFFSLNLQLSLATDWLIFLIKRCTTSLHRTMDIQSQNS